MPQKSERHILRGDARAIIRHPQIGDAAIFDLDADLVRTGIDGILHKLLTGRGGAVDDLPRRDQLGDLPAEQLDPSHFHLPLCRRLPDILSFGTAFRPISPIPRRPASPPHSGGRSTAKGGRLRKMPNRMSTATAHQMPACKRRLSVRLPVRQ